MIVAVVALAILCLIAEFGLIQAYEDKANAYQNAATFRLEAVQDLTEEQRRADTERNEVVQNLIAEHNALTQALIGRHHEQVDLLVARHHERLDKLLLAAVDRQSYATVERAEAVEGTFHAQAGARRALIDEAVLRQNREADEHSRFDYVGGAT